MSTSPPSRPPAVRLARWSATHSARALLVWFAVLAAAVSTLMLVPTQQTSAEDSRFGDSGRVAAQLEADALADPQTEAVLITDGDRVLDDGAVTAAAGDLRTTLGDLPGVKIVGDATWSDDRRAALVPITMTGSVDEASDRIGPVVEATNEVAAAHPGLTLVQSGSASIDQAIWTRVGEDLGSAEALSLPITLVIMIIAFGAVIAAGIPVLLAAGSVVMALGFYAPISYVFPDAGSVANVVLLIGMAVGVDYSLFYLKREREERARGRSTIDAIEIAAATAGRAVVVSGFAVMVSMAGLFLTFDPTFTSMAAASVVVVAVAVLGSLTFLPASLSALGRWVDRGRVPFVGRLAGRAGSAGISGRLIRPVVARPAIAAAVAVAVLAALAVPALGLKTRGGTLETLPQDLPPVAAAQRMQQDFSTERPGVDVMLRSDARLDRDAAATALRDIGATAESEGLVSSASGAPRFSADGRVAVMTLESAFAETDRSADSMLERMRDTIVPRAASDLSAEALVGGSAAETYDYEHRTSTLPLVIAFVLLLTMVMMWRTFRSLTLALLTTGLNLLSVGASFGVLTLVFQHGWAEGLLNFTSTGFVVDWIPLFCFVILAGLSMDYHVFVLSRVREGVRRGLPFDRAVELGVGLSVAILLDATLVRLVLLPASLLLLKNRLTGLAADASPSAHDAPVGPGCFGRTSVSQVK